MRTSLVVTVTVVLAAASASCGGSGESKTQPKKPPAVGSEQRSVVATIDELQAAARHGDARKICGELFTEELARSIGTAGKSSCVQEVRQRLISPREEISVGRDIRINGGRATAVIREQNGDTSTLFLVKQGPRWKIQRLTPVQGQ